MQKVSAITNYNKYETKDKSWRDFFINEYIDIKFGGKVYPFVLIPHFPIIYKCSMNDISYHFLLGKI